MSSKTIYIYPSQEVRNLIKNYIKENSKCFFSDKFLFEVITPFGYSKSEFSRIIYDCRNNIYTQPKCYCGNDIKFINYSSGYSNYCSKKCQANSPEIKEKKKQTCLKNHGVENPSQSCKIKEKSKQTCLKNHGVEYSMQSPEIKEKSKQTCLKNHGVENPSQSKKIKEKFKQTMMERHGVEYSMQSPEIFKKQQESSFKFKEHRGFKCQGYEPKAIDFLIDVLNINPENITTSRFEIPSIPYIFKDKKHVYHPDILIKTNNILIEVKSSYTWKLHYNSNIIKMKTSNAILMIFDDTSRLPLAYYGDYPDENLNLF